MRKHLRALARANVERAGIQKINKPRTYNGLRAPSVFAAKWRDYVFTPPEIAKACAKQRAEQERKREIRNSRRAEKRLAS